ncbi:PD-(D/E)XK motif protein [Rhizobium rhizogenes]|uniref:PD-(D/E)XK motif protein n=1 Tax=Rhizobium rhizogenes TaxID=359 RepID=UPI001573B826|nr:PD-(D/E)XK motif protein [Rhizobium rhizogenes]NTI33390.1 PD-(D/E)XK motif protein [Rhizobium rhizogenes]WEO65089.1 PD-(D/E)XK motif protein [Rhizobium rhizogenes]
MLTEPPLEHWTMLRRGSHASNGLEIPSVDTGIETGFGSIRLALGKTGQLRLLLPVRHSERIAAVPSSRSLEIGVAVYSLNGASIRYLDIVCLAGGLDGVFADVSKEIIQRIRTGSSPVDACATTLDDFRSLLVDPPSEVTIQQVRGLVGELLMLRRMLRLDRRAWQLWRGPIMERHDFRVGNLALEVKSSARVTGLSVQISAIDQLLAPASGVLHLALYQLEQTTGGDLSVSTLAAETTSMASDSIQVRSLLAAVGCADPDAPMWNRTFRLEGEHHYLVDGSFPRIIPESFAAGSLPTGVTGLSYSIDLAMAEASSLTASRTEAHIGEMIACLDNP